MTDQQHLITPPQDQVYKWWEEACKRPPSSFYEKLDYVAEQAAQWGWQQRDVSVAEELQKARDEELQASCEWLLRNGWAPSINRLRAARRPKPPSLAEEALQEINAAECFMDSANLGYDFTAVHRALERLQELEGQGDD